MAGLELGGARDDEVALRHLAELVDALPAEAVRGPVAARVSEARMRQERAGADRVLATLGDPRYARLVDDLARMIADPPLLDRAQRPARPVLRRALRGTRKRLVRRVDAAETGVASGDGDPLHDVRKAVKRVRYTAEVAGPRLGGRTIGLVPAMQLLQDVLGERQDSIVTRAYCRRLGIAAAAAGETAWTYRRLYALEEEREARSERAFWVRWHELERPGASGPRRHRGVT